MLPIVAEVSSRQFQKAYSPILVTLFGIVIEDSESQRENTLRPRVVTLFGIVIEVREEQLRKAPLARVVIVLGMIVFLHPLISVLVAVSISALQFSRLSYLALPFSTTIDTRLVTSSGKKESPILTTLLGITIEVKSSKQ